MILEEEKYGAFENKNAIQFDYLLFVKRFLFFLLILFLFLFSLDLLSNAAVKTHGFIDKEVIESLNNPFISFAIGLFLTAIFQSSSLTTSLTVVLVGKSLIGFKAAIFIMMGANLGTTITSMIISLGHLSSAKGFKKAISCALLHHNFNLISILLFFPLEYFFGLFSNTTNLIVTKLGFKFENFHQSSNFFEFNIEKFNTFLHANFPSWMIFLFGILLLFISIRLFISLLKVALLTRFDEKIESYFFGNQLVSLFSGLGITALIHSSTVVTAFLVPYTATSKISLKKAYPFIIGANIGTTFTAIVAALSSNSLAMSLAFAYFLFNFLGLISFYPTQFQRNIILKPAKYMGKAISRNPLLLFVYVLLVFFVIPFITIALSRN